MEQVVNFDVVGFAGDLNWNLAGKTNSGGDYSGRQCIEKTVVVASPMAKPGTACGESQARNEHQGNFPDIHCWIQGGIRFHDAKPVGTPLIHMSRRMP